MTLPTQEELEKYFKEYLDDAVQSKVCDAADRPLTQDGLLFEIRRWYDGFRFSENGENVYNPVSIGQFIFNKYRFKNYWFSTGTPTFLMNLLKKNGIVDSDLEDLAMPEAMFDTFDVTELAGEYVPEERIFQMLYQTRKRFCYLWYQT